MSLGFLRRGLPVPVRELLRIGQMTGLKLAASGLALVFGIVATQIVGAEHFGIFVSIFTVAALVGVATNLGLPALLMRELAASRGSGDTGSIGPLIHGIGLVNFLFLLALGIAIALQNVVAALAILFVILGNALGLLGAVLNAHEKVLAAAWAGDFVRSVATLGCLLVLGAMMTPSELLPLYAQIAGLAIAVFILFVIWRLRTHSTQPVDLTLRLWSERHGTLLRSGLIFAGMQLLINLTTQVDILILTAIATPVDVAHYYAAVRAALVINFCFGAAGLLAEPTLTRLFAAGEMAQVRRETRSTARNGFLLTIVAAVPALAIAPFYLSLYGPGFIDAFPSFCAFAGGIVVRSMFGPSENLVRAARGEADLLKITAMAIVINVLLSLALIPWLGILGAAIGSAIQFVVYGWSLARSAERRTGFNPGILAAYRTDGESS